MIDLQRTKGKAQEQIKYIDGSGLRLLLEHF